MPFFHAYVIMDSMEIRRTEERDIPAVMALYNSAKTYMQENGFSQWTVVYPLAEDIIEDIKASAGYVLTDGDEIVASACILFGEDACYGEIDGAWINDRPYGVIHRIVVAPHKKGNDLAGLFLKEAVRQAKALGVKDLRIDTHAKNMSMRKWIAKHGFAYCGIIHVEDGTPRFAYQKEL